MALAVQEKKRFGEIEPGCCFRTGPLGGNRHYVKWNLRRDWVAIELQPKGDTFEVRYTQDHPDGKFEFFNPEATAIPVGKVIRNLKEVGWKD